MRFWISATIAAALLATNAFAADISAPLAPGKPAGLKQAQDGDNTVLYVLGGAAVIAGIAILVSSGNGNNSNNGGTSASAGTP